MSIFKKETTETPRIITMDEHGTWGNSISFFDWESRRVTGHMRQKPKVKDILRCKMSSGKVARFEFTEVKSMSDPPDQFFATVKDLDYEPI